MGLAAAVELLGVGSLPFAVGLYLPIHLTSPIMVGGIIKKITEKRAKDKVDLKEKSERGILLASGLIAGEALMGVLVAIAVTTGIAMPETSLFGPIFGLSAFIIVAIYLFYASNSRISK